MKKVNLDDASKPMVTRLSLYRDTIQRFKSYGVKWIMSENIASALGIKAAQVRKDLSLFGITGKRKAGYQVEHLIESVDRLLGKTEVYDAVFAGLGGLGKSLLQEKVFARQNIRILAVFDDEIRRDDPQARSLGVDVHPISELASFTLKNHVRFGVIGSGPQTAQRLADLMVISGIEGILSLAPVELKVPAHCIVSTINVAHELERIIYFANHNSGQRARKPL